MPACRSKVKAGMTSGSMEYGYNGIEYEDFLELDMNLASYRGLDPALGRWCQIDPKAESSIALSPYNSMSNNPISNVDPNGDSPILIGAAVGFLSNGIQNAISGNNFFQGGLKAAFIGAWGGGVSAGIGQAFGNVSGFGNELLRAGAHGVSGGLQSMASGGSFGSGFLSGGISSGVGSGIDALGGGATAQWAGGGLSGGIGSVIGGGNFFQGAGMGLMVGGLNHAVNHAANSLFSGDPPSLLDRIKKKLNELREFLSQGGESPSLTDIEIALHDAAADVQTHGETYQMAVSLLGPGGLTKPGLNPKAWKLYSNATYKAFEKQLQQHGRKSLIRSRNKLQRRLQEHISKLGNIQSKGGYSSSVHREINTFRSQIQAIDDLLGY